jgi:hypothetical protein
MLAHWLQGGGSGASTGELPVHLARRYCGAAVLCLASPRVHTYQHRLSDGTITGSFIVVVVVR